MENKQAIYMHTSQFSMYSVAYTKHFGLKIKLFSVLLLFYICKKKRTTQKDSDQTTQFIHVDDVDVCACHLHIRRGYQFWGTNTQLKFNKNKC